MRTEKADKHLAKIRGRETPYLVNFSGIEITIFENVYPTTELSELVVECMDDSVIGIGPGSKVLDYGTGTGFLAIQAALRGAIVTAVDINPDAIKCATYNAQKHNVVNKVDFRMSNALEAIRSDEQFEVVFAGIPFDDSEPVDLLERSMYDPGFSMRNQLLSRAPRLLYPNGRIFRTYSEQAQLRHPVEEYHPLFDYSIARTRNIKEEPHFIYMIKPKHYE